MTRSLELAPESTGPSEDWPSEPEEGYERWVFMKTVGGRKMEGLPGMQITPEMVCALDGLLLPVAYTKLMRRLGRGAPLEPTLIGIDADVIALHLQAFGNGNAHLAGAWRRAAEHASSSLDDSNRVYLAVGALMVYDVQRGIIPTPEDVE